MSLGPVMVGLSGLEVLAEEREILEHPMVGGVVLFSRNYESASQLESLVRAIHEVRKPRLLVSVDQEGGRVQRFREGFTVLPAMRQLGEVYDERPERAHRLADLAGWVMAAELRAVDIDFSFAPVLDLECGVSKVIGDRAFHSDPNVVAELAQRFMAGMHRAGMAATGKHFPGHGAVACDTHHKVAKDERDYDTVYKEDVLPYKHMIKHGLAAVMAAHVIYPKIDEHPASFSEFWLQTVLRKRMNFHGVIFSDDLLMEGARVAGDMTARAQAALDAGCDMVLVCDSTSVTAEVLDALRVEQDPASNMRLARMHGRLNITRQELQQDPEWREAVLALRELTYPESLDLL